MRHVSYVKIGKFILLFLYDYLGLFMGWLNKRERYTIAEDLSVKVVALLRENLITS